MRVSVVIPAYNAERFIVRTLESALTQSPYVDEVFVVDDTSTDRTVELARSFGDRVTVVEQEHSGNPAVSRNWGVQNARNELIAFLDADDVWLPGKLEMQIARLAADESLGAVCTNAYKQTEPDKWEGLGLLLQPSNPDVTDPLDRLLLDNYVITSSVLARRSVLLEAGLFSVEEHLPAVEDYDLWLRVAAITRLEYVDEPWLFYRDWGASYRGVWSEVQTAQGLLRVLERLEEHVPGTEQAHRSAFRTRRAHLNWEISFAARRLGDRGLAVRAAVACIRERPGLAMGWKALAAATGAKSSPNAAA